LEAAGVGVVSLAGVRTAQAAGGDEIWRFETGNFVQLSPTVVDGTVFVGSADNNVYALDATDGTEQWRFDTGKAVFSSPTVVDGTVFVGTDDKNVYALDANDGTEQWRFETAAIVRSSPTVVNGTVFVGSQDNNMYALDAGVSGSSEGSRVMLGTLGHHGDWRYADQSIGTPKETPTETPTKPPTESTGTPRLTTTKPSQGTTSPPTNTLDRQSGDQDDEAASASNASENGGIPVLNRFDDSDSFAWLLLLGLAGGAGGYGLYRRRSNGVGNRADSARRPQRLGEVNNESSDMNEDGWSSERKRRGTGRGDDRRSREPGDER
jgi:hypothetical protein